MASSIGSVASNRISVQSTTDSTHEDTKEMTCKDILVLLAMGTLILTLLIYTIINSLRCRPNICIQEFQVPALRHPTHFNATSLNTTIFIDLNFQNDWNPLPNSSYADLEMTVFYGVDKSFPVANYTIPAFAMGNASSVHKRVAVEAPGLPWEAAFANVSGWQPVYFAVELAVKYSDRDRNNRRIAGIREGTRVAADVRVDGSGEMVPNYPNIGPVSLF